MNNPYMFSPVISPFADNPKYVKKIFSTRIVVYSLIVLGVILTATIYGAVCMFNSEKVGGIILSQDEEIVNVLNSSTEGFSQIIVFAVLFLVFVGFVSLFMNTRSKFANNSGPGTAPFTLFRIFFIIMIFHSVSNLFSSVTSPMAELIVSTNAEYDFLSMALYALPAITGTLWSVAGLVTCSNIIKTIKCMTLSDKGCKFYLISACIHAVSMAATMVLYFATGFSKGIFKSYDETTPQLKKTIIDATPSAAIIFVIFFVSCSVVLVLSALLAKRYSNGIQNAVRSVNMYGTNMYMNSNGTAADFYSRPYAPNPPMPAATMGQQFYSLQAGGIPSAPVQIMTPPVPAPFAPQSAPVNTPAQTAASPVADNVNIVKDSTPVISTYENEKTVAASVPDTDNPAETEAEPVQDQETPAEPDNISADEESLPPSVVKEEFPAVKNGTYICQRCGTVNLVENKFCYTCGNQRSST